jgi:hypothetical protein
MYSLWIVSTSNPFIYISSWEISLSECPKWKVSKNNWRIVGKIVVVGGSVVVVVGKVVAGGTVVVVGTVVGRTVVFIGAVVVVGTVVGRTVVFIGAVVVGRTVVVCWMITKGKIKQKVSINWTPSF